MAELHETPFDDAEHAFFHMVQYQRARHDGARFVAGAGLYNRPSHPDDIRIVIDRLYRQKKLGHDHIKILKHFGVRMMPPDDRRENEKRAYDLWHDAMGIIGAELRRKGIIE